ncbi:hypothetical protein T492DRAFT_942881 [Pavlovales sp. CCMP2436]|nr:hypothetical protein T492DRAFT_942881 [Pavlovales sp. CCMP2436]
MLPGWAFSRALAAFKVEGRVQAKADGNADGKAADKQKQKQKQQQQTQAQAPAPPADELLDTALLWFPMQLRSVLLASSASDPRSAPLLRAWDEALAAVVAAAPAEHADVLADVVGEGEGGSLLLARLLALYAEQTVDLWRDTAVVGWLDSRVHSLSFRLRTAGGPEATALLGCARARLAAYPRAQSDCLAGSEYAELKEEARHGLIPADVNGGERERLRVPAAAELAAQVRFFLLFLLFSFSFLLHMLPRLSLWRRCTRFFCMLCTSFLYHIPCPRTHTRMSRGIISSIPLACLKRTGSADARFFLFLFMGGGGLVH